MRLTYLSIKTLLMVTVICLAGVSANAHEMLQWPHNDGCDYCHHSHHSGEPSLLPATTNIPPTNIEETQYNNLCQSCHATGGGPFVNTHSSVQIDNGYGDWSVDCRTCHDPHLHEQYTYAPYGTGSHLYTGISEGLTGTVLTDDEAAFPTDADDNLTGMVLIPNTAQYTWSYKIIANTATTITVDDDNGTKPITNASIGDTYVVILGKLMNYQVKLADIITYLGVSDEITTTTLKELSAVVTNDPGGGDHNYRCIKTHKSNEVDAEPGVGADEATYWLDLGLGSGNPQWDAGSYYKGDWAVDKFAGKKLMPSLTYKTTRYAITGNTTDTITVTGPIDLTKCEIDRMFEVVEMKTGTNPVKYFRRTGVNSFADGDVDYDGICEVCHTQTTYHRNTAAGDHNHQKSDRCTDCHLHIEGFNPSCESCHGFPPTIASELVDPLLRPPGTGSSTAGAHDKHVNLKGFECDICHYESVGFNYPSHDNALTITLGFSLFGSAYVGGDYDGQSGLAYNTNDAVNNNITSPGLGTKTCSNLYCHGTYPLNHATQPGADWGGGQDTTPVWSSSITTCNPCHDAGGDGTGLSGRHDTHTHGSTYDFFCDKCHVETAAVDSKTEIKDENLPSPVNNPYHVNNVKDALFKTTRGLAGSFDKSTKACSSTYCHSNAVGGAPNLPVSPELLQWDDADTTTPPDHADCFLCHDAKTGDICDKTGSPGLCEMSTNGHDWLIGSTSPRIRKYACYKCHDATVNIRAGGPGSPETIKDFTKHVTNGVVDVVIPNPEGYIISSPDATPAPTYNSSTMVCLNIYCHSDGTTVRDNDADPPIIVEVRPFAWNAGTHTKCNSCHGDDSGTQWPPGDEYKAASPAYESRTGKPNSHPRHLTTSFVAESACYNCHSVTIIDDDGDPETPPTCSNTNCHSGGPPGDMTSEAQHLNPVFHINKFPDIVLAAGDWHGSDLSCTSTDCHNGSAPIWGQKVDNEIVCLTCHRTPGPDVDSFDYTDGIQARINEEDWYTTGHGRPDTGDPQADKYVSGNPPANLTGNACWYCHDEEVLHDDANNPFRLRIHDQYTNRFAKECVFCHMEEDEAECLTCHYDPTGETLAPQVDDGPTGPVFIAHNDQTITSGCITGPGCHEGNPPDPHNTGAGIWTVAQKDDIKSQYEMMGVCLTCHDDDSNGQCVQCHQNTDDVCVDDSECTTPGEICVPTTGTCQKYYVGFDPKMVDTTFNVAQTKVTSAHFGHKHYEAYQSNGDWKGGKFCWDCHDPHGDDNIYMIQDKVATETDGVFGIPVPGSRLDVEFTQIVDGDDYVKWPPNPKYGICNVCHTNTEHYRNTAGTAPGGDNHRRRRICTVCHEHGFEKSHASGQSCYTCHGYRPVPRHTAFGLPRDCTKCHYGTIGARMNIIGQFGANSHHVQIKDADDNVLITNKHCYACHWEANDVGLINLDIVNDGTGDRVAHEGYDYKNHTTVADAKVDLVIWEPGQRPFAFEPSANLVKHNGRKYTCILGHESTQMGGIDEPVPGGNEYWRDDGLEAGTEDNWNENTPYASQSTYSTFLASDITVGGANERAQVSNATLHCLGCHNDDNKYTQVFGIVDPDFDDCKTPSQYAWDRSSVGARYSNTTATSWGKYIQGFGAGEYPNVNDKSEITKAFSAHGNAVANEGGWSEVNITPGPGGEFTYIKGLDEGLDAAAVNKRPGLDNIQCYDCHSSHGSMASGITSSYAGFEGDFKGANLKETQGGKGGYQDTYVAKDNVTPDENPYATQTGQCFDCHETQLKGGVTDGGKTPWGYDQTFGADAPVMGFKDNPRFSDATATSALKDRFAYRAGKTLLGGHLKASSPLKGLDGTPDEEPDNPNTGDEATGTIRGLCSYCHDPHGVTESLGTDMVYAVPILKGTWLTSPFKDDVPANEGDSSYNDSCCTNSRSTYWQKHNNYWGSSWKPHPNRADPQYDVWRTDRNTFNTADLSLQSSQTMWDDKYDRITETDSQFAGLCLTCHPKSTLTNTTTGSTGDNADFRTLDRIHTSVKDWGDNIEHSFPCSKCHQVHESGLPRLMQTNCLDYKHRDKQVSGGVAIYAELNRGYQGSYWRQYWGMFPYGWWNWKGSIDNDKYGSYRSGGRKYGNCHGDQYPNLPTSAGWPDNQIWNDITPW